MIKKMISYKNLIYSIFAKIKSETLNMIMSLNSLSMYYHKNRTFKKQIPMKKHICPKCKKKRTTLEFYWSKGRIASDCKSCIQEENDAFEKELTERNKIEKERLQTIPEKYLNFDINEFILNFDNETNIVIPSTEYGYHYIFDFKVKNNTIFLDINDCCYDGYYEYNPNEINYEFSNPTELKICIIDFLNNNIQHNEIEEWIKHLLNFLKRKDI